METKTGDRFGYFMLQFKGTALRIIASDGVGWDELGFDPPVWEHVSVSTEFRTPWWDEMAYVRDLFWSDEELVLQFHVPKSMHINVHPFCLHLWRPIGVEIPLPPIQTLA